MVGNWGYRHTLWICYIITFPWQNSYANALQWHIMSTLRVLLMRLWMEHKFRSHKLVIHLSVFYVLQYGTHIDIVYVAFIFLHTQCKRTVHQVPETVDCCAGCLQQGHDDGWIRRREEQGQQQQGHEYDPGWHRARVAVGTCKKIVKINLEFH